MLKLMGEIRGQWAGNHTSPPVVSPPLFGKLSLLGTMWSAKLGSALVKTKLYGKIQVPTGKVYHDPNLDRNLIF